MYEELDKAAETLADAKAGWVTRRDAVDALSGAARRALNALKRHENDTDVDVRAATQKALEQVVGLLHDVKGSARTFTLDELVHAVEKKGERKVTRVEKGFTVDVQLKNGRKQRVYIAPHEIREGSPLIRVLTYCGKPKEGTMDWALRANLQLAHGAIGLIEEEGKKEFVIVNCFLASETTPLEMKNSVKEIAYYGDWLEAKLTGRDTQ